MTGLGDLGPFWLSIRVALAATALIVIVGVPTAWVLARARFPGKGLISGLLVLPLVVPPTVLGFAMLQVLGRRGWVGSWLESTWGVSVVFHWSGAVLASAVAAFPMFLLPARGGFEGVAPAFEDAARLLGRGEASVFLRVTIPLAWRGLVAGTVLAFARAIGDFGATLMVAGDIPGRTRTASLAIYDAVNAEDPARAAGLSAMVALASIAAVLVAQWTMPSRRGGDMVSSLSQSAPLSLWERVGVRARRDTIEIRTRIVGYHRVGEDPHPGPLPEGEGGRVHPHPGPLPEGEGEGGHEMHRPEQEPGC